MLAADSRFSGVPRLFHQSKIVNHYCKVSWTIISSLFSFFVITDPTQAAYATGLQMLDMTNG